MATNTFIKRKSHLPRLSSKGKVILIITLFVLIALMLEGMIYLQGNVFDGVRSYVRGEGLWAKAQKDAVFYLTRYSYSFAETDFLAYQKSVQVILGDQQARLALQETPPNTQAAQGGFLQGQNDLRDIDSMIWFFRNFHNVTYMREAIEIWQRADQKIAELIAIGGDLRQEIKTVGKSSQQIHVLRNRLEHLDNELLKLENRFSFTLGEGARWVKNATWLMSITMLIGFVGIGIIVSLQIIKRITRAENELIASESRFRSLKDSNTLGIVSWDINGLIHEANDIFLDMLGYQADDLSAGVINWREITPKEFLVRDRRAIQELVENGHCEPFEKALLHKHGHSIPVYVGASLLDGDAEQGIAFVMDLSERKKSEEQLRLAATVFDASTDGILITDPSASIISANQALCSMFGYEKHELKGKTPRVLQSGTTPDEKYREIWDSLNQQGYWQGDIIDRHKNGALLPMRLSISSVKDPHGEVSHFVAILSDISQRKAEEAQLRHMAHHDTLTGLPNRVLLNDRIEHLIKRANRNQSQFAILFFDLNNFKPINDLFGHTVGDKLLRVVADRLTNAVRSSDTVARIGGDEFIVLVEDIEDRYIVNGIIDKTLMAVARPCRIDEHDIEISISVGTSIYPSDGLDMISLIHHADVAMYSMKGESRPDGQPRR